MNFELIAGLTFISLRKICENTGFADTNFPKFSHILRSASYKGERLLFHVTKPFAQRS